MENEMRPIDLLVIDEEMLETPCESVDIHTKKPSRKKIAVIMAAVIVLLVAVGCVADLLDAPILRYYSAVVKLERGEYSEAKTAFEQLDAYKNSAELVREAEKGLRYREAGEHLGKGNYADALAVYEELGDFLDTQEKLREARYLYAVQLLEQGETDAAADLLEQVREYRDSYALLCENVYEIRYERGMQSMAREKYDTAVEHFLAARDFKDAPEKAEECRILGEKETAYKSGKRFYNDGSWEEAYKALSQIGDAAYKDASVMMEDIRTRASEYARSYAENGEPGKALAFLRVVEVIDEAKGRAMREELFPAETFAPDQSFYFFDTTHMTNFTADTPTEDFASVVLYMLLQGKMHFAVMSNKAVGYDILKDKAFQGSNLAQEMLPGYGSIYNPSVLIGDNYVTYDLTYEQEYSEHQRTVHLKTFKTFCEDSVRELTEMGLLTSTMSRRQKAEVIIHWVGFYLTYDQSLTIHDVGVAIEEKRGVCESFAALYNRMCNLAGVPTYGQVGDARTGPNSVGKHIWSFHVDEDGTIFYADATWGDLWDIDFGLESQKEEPTVELFAQKYLELCMKKALAEQSGSGSSHLVRQDLVIYVCSDTLWPTHKAERNAQQIIAYHEKITGKSA